MEIIYLVVPNQSLVGHLANIAPFVSFDNGKAEISTSDQTAFQDYMAGLGYCEGEDFQFESVGGLTDDNGYDQQLDLSGDGRYGGNYFPSAQTDTAQDNSKMGKSAATHGNNPMHKLKEDDKTREEVLKDHIRHHREQQRRLGKDSVSYKDHQAAINRFRSELDQYTSEPVLDEDKLSKKQEADKEDTVLAMKKDSDGFKKRYGDRWKEVMYATATKQSLNDDVRDVKNELKESYKQFKTKE